VWSDANTVRPDSLLIIRGLIFSTYCLALSIPAAPSLFFLAKNEKSITNIPNIVGIVNTMIRVILVSQRLFARNVSRRPLLIPWKFLHNLTIQVFHAQMVIVRAVSPLVLFLVWFIAVQNALPLAKLTASLVVCRNALLLALITSFPLVMSIATPTSRHPFALHKLKPLRIHDLLNAHYITVQKVWVSWNYLEPRL
jgi:hypothetical protein